MLGQIACGGRAVALDHFEKACAVVVAVERDRIVGVIGFEFVLRLCEQFGGLLVTRFADEIAVADPEAAQQYQYNQPQRERLSVFSKKSSVRLIAMPMLSSVEFAAF